MNSIPLTRRAALVLPLGLASAWTEASAQAWPTKPVRLVVPFPPGGSGDSVARLLGNSLGERLGQQVVVDNKPGGNLFIGVSEVARAPADGYTLLMTLDIAFTANPYVFSKLPYDAAKDFTPVTQLTSQSLWFAVKADSPIKSMGDLIAEAKARPGRLNYGSGALVAQLTGELLKSITGVSMTYVPYKGSALATQALLGGELDVVISDITPLLPFIQTGRLRALGQTGTTRSPILPQVPTMLDQGMKDLHFVGWFGLFAPAGTPQAIVDRLATEVEHILARPELRERVAAFGLQATTGTPAALARLVKEDAARWATLIRTAGIRLD